MSIPPQPRYSKEEFARRGNEIYEREVQPRLTEEDRGKFVAIDIEGGTFEVDVDEITASHRLLARNPDAQIWFRLVGSPQTRRFGPRSRNAA
ncbi:MAG TPA: hypothetical protein VIJ26_17795 [Thermoanaerobaculia bacterium]